MPVDSALLAMASASGDGPSISADLDAAFKAFSPSDIGCTAYPAGTFAGQVAVIRRGTCTFATKVTNAASAGALAVIVANNVPGPPTAMGGLIATTIPAWMVSQSDGDSLVAWAMANAGTARLRVNKALTAFSDPSYADTLASFSSLGPAVGLGIKPDLVAPGVNILSAVSPVHGTTTPAFALYQGTSMATPHVAGAGALLRQSAPELDA